MVRRLGAWGREIEAIRDTGDKSDRGRLCLGARAITDAETLMWMCWGLTKGSHRRAAVDGGHNFWRIFNSICC